jgi:hypothetical protein
LPWRSDGGLTTASSYTAVSRRIESKPKTKKAPPRSTGWIAPRGENQCADNLLQAKRRANEVRFILPFLIGRTKSTLNYDILRLFAHAQIPFSLH